MESQNPFIPVLDQLIKLMELIQSKSKISPKIPDSLVDDIKLLEKKFKEVESFTKNQLETDERDITSLRIETSHSSNVPAKDKKMIERAVQIKKDMKILRSELSKVKVKAGATEEKTENAEKSDIKKKRRKTFKTHGTDTNWIPL